MAAQKREEAELVYALAELSWIEAKRLDHRRKPQAIDRYLDAAGYAYDYLFDQDPVLAEGRGPSDPRFRLAMEIYNAGVDRLIRAAQTKGQILPQNGEAIPFKVHGREQSLRFAFAKLPGAWLTSTSCSWPRISKSAASKGPLSIWTGRAPDRRP